MNFVTALPTLLSRKIIRLRQTKHHSVVPKEEELDHVRATLGPDPQNPQRLGHKPMHTYDHTVES